MIDINDEETFRRFESDPNCIVVMLPAWSAYVSRLREQLPSIEDSLKEAGVSVYVVTNDDPDRNAEWAKWVSDNDKAPVPLLPDIATGSGEIICVRDGQVLHVARVCWDRDAEDLVAFVEERFKTKTPIPIPKAGAWPPPSGPTTDYPPIDM